MGTISMASQGQPSRNAPSGPLLTHFLQPMHRNGSTSMRPNGGCSSSGTQYMQSATGQYGTHAGDPAQPVQHSVMIASSFGFFFRGVVIPSDFGSIFSTVAVIIELSHRPLRESFSARGPALDCLSAALSLARSPSDASARTSAVSRIR